MGLISFVAPILPGKTDEWRRWMGELNGPRHQEYVEARQKYGIQERVYFQTTPMGDLVIVTLEGDDPEQSMKDWANSQDPFTRWFVQRVKEAHGFDLPQVLTQPMPQMLVDSGPISGTRGQRRVA